jgi:hypothetical protein
MMLKLAGVAAWFFFITFGIVSAEDPYRFFNWNITYGNIYPLGVAQQVCIQSIPFNHNGFEGEFF